MNIQNVVKMVESINKLIVDKVTGTGNQFFYLTLEICLGYYNIRYLGIVIYSSDEGGFDDESPEGIQEINDICVDEVLQIVTAVSPMAEHLKNQ